VNNRRALGEGRRAPPRPPLQLYEIFVRVAEACSFVGAGKLVGISQPAVSQAIARLEDYYPGDLFVRRRGAPLVLTPVGEALLPLAKAMLQAADQSFIRTEAASHSQRGRLSVGFYPGVASGPLREGIKSFREECPEVELDLVESMPSDLHAQLCARQLDLIISAFVAYLGAGDLTQEKLWSEQLVAILPERHELAGRSSLRWAEIARMQIILRAAGGDLSGYRAILAAVGPGSLNCRQFAVSRGTLTQLVTMEFGVAISFSSAVMPMPGVTAVPIDGANATVPVEGIWRANDGNPIRHRFVRHLREAAKTASDP